MIYQASMLLAKLRNLTLVGQSSEGDLEWIGTDEQWGRVDNEAEEILREWDDKKEWEANFNELYQFYHQK